MLNFLSIAVLSVAGLLWTTSAAEARGRRCCGCTGSAAAAPVSPAPDAPPAPTTSAQSPDGAQVVRSYSYEPSTTYRSYGGTNRSQYRRQFDAGRKIWGL